MSQRPPLRIADPPPPGWPDWMERWVLPYVREPALLPVLLALLGHVVVVLVPLMLGTWRTGHGAVVALLVAAVLGSVGLVGFESVRFRRPGAVTLTVLGTWAVSVGLAWFCERTGVM
ncbi:MAG: hypothetical protein R3F59_17450 [Myxococcota bacterium]